MIVRFKRASIATLVGCGVLAACSPQETASTGTPAAAVSAATAGGPTDDPCALVTDQEVRAAFADAKAGKRDHSLDQYQIATCKWDTPANTFVAQVFKAKGTVEDELRSRASGLIDPMKPGAGKGVRYEKLAGVGEETMITAEPGDAAAGLFNDIAVLVTKRGDRMAVLFAQSLVDADRAKTKAALEALGRSAAARL
jgi:hypothetical protein